MNITKVFGSCHKNNDEKKCLINRTVKGEYHTDAEIHNNYYML